MNVFNIQDNFKFGQQTRLIKIDHLHQTNGNVTVLFHINGGESVMTSNLQRVRRQHIGTSKL